MSRDGQLYFRAFPCIKNINNVTKPMKLLELFSSNVEFLMSLFNTPGDSRAILSRRNSLSIEGGIALYGLPNETSWNERGGRKVKKRKEI